MLTASLLVVTLATVGLAQDGARHFGLPNFNKVNAQLYRGGQPKKEGLRKLKELGVRTIVNLRGQDDQTRAEGEEAQKLGLRYYSIALPEFSKPKDGEVQRVLDIINAPENQPVFVHCHHGRTAPARSSPATAFRMTAGTPSKRRARQNTTA